jgi:hypothetical protein
MTMATYQFGDIPQFPDEMVESRYAGCGLDAYNYTNTFEREQLGFVSDDDMYLKGLDGRMANMPLMQHASHYHYSHSHSPFQPTMHVQRQLQSQYEPQWPYADVSGDRSPERQSVSESSESSQSDVHSPPMYHTIPYGSPNDSYVPSLVPYQAAEHFDEGCYPSHNTLHGGSIINMRMLEFQHQETETEAALEDNDNIDFKQDTACDQEDTIAVKVETATPDGSETYADSGLGNSVRDAESVQPMEGQEIPEDPESDEEYSPKASRTTKRRRSSASSGGSSRSSKRKLSTTSTSSTSNKASKRVRRTSSTTKKQVIIDTDERPFPCPLAAYGCDLTFSSKNEWKRHVSTQHIKLSYWRCDLCKPSVDNKDENTLYYNDFNRKDLYTQHIRRMHAAPKDSRTHSAKDFPVTEENLHDHQIRCLKALRKSPMHSCCLFCDKTFEGPGSWEERMEHVGRHLEKDKKGTVDVKSWKPDIDLERYLLEEGLIVHEHGQWRIGDGKPLRRAYAESATDSDDE